MEYPDWFSGYQGWNRGYGSNPFALWMKRRHRLEQELESLKKKKNGLEMESLEKRRYSGQGRFDWKRKRMGSEFLGKR